MPEKVLPGPLNGCQPPVKEAVCIHTNRIYDSCRDKECLEDLRVFPTRCSQELIDKASSVKPKCAELLCTLIDVQEVSFNRGFFAVDITFFYRVVCEAFLCGGRPHEVCGLATYDKRVILFGSEGNVHIFNSKMNLSCTSDKYLCNSNLPTAIVEAVDPILLGTKLCDTCECCCGKDDPCEIPTFINDFFGDELVVGGDCKRMFATLGQFSIVRLERDSQLLIPSFDFCMPKKECVGNTNSEDSACDLFRKIKFPVEQFFPPSLRDENCDHKDDDHGSCRSCK